MQNEKSDVLNMLDEMLRSVESLIEDVKYGASLDKLPTHNFLEVNTELGVMEKRLGRISEDVAMQLIIKDAGHWVKATDD